MTRKHLPKIREILCVGMSGPEFEEFMQSVAAVNVTRAKQVSLLFAVFEGIMLVWSAVSGHPGEENGKRACYIGMYWAMFSAMVCFFFLFIYFGKNLGKHTKAIRVWGTAFTAFILCWCAGISLLDYASSQQIMVYTFAVLAAAGTPYATPLNSLAVLLPVQAAFVALLFRSASLQNIPYGAAINSTFFVVMAWVISMMRFHKQMEVFRNEKLVERKNEELLRVNRELEEANEKLRVLSATDSLTGIANRAMFDTCLAAGWNVCGRQHAPLTLFMVDIDFFKGYNDNYGHQAGDECLRKVAETLSSFAKRSSDTAARYGGEEFALILPFMSREEAESFCTQVVEAVRKLNIPYDSSPVCRYVTISLGASTVVPGVCGSAEELVATADKALYLAKKQRNRAVMLLSGKNPPERDGGAQRT